MFASNTSQVSNGATYIEDVFSTWLYTGNGSSTGPTIANGIDLSTYGGMVWTKARDVTGTGHMLFDTARGGNSVLTTSGDTNYLGGNGTNAATVYGFNLRNFLTNGFNIRNTTSPADNGNGSLYTSWTFREQPKFFDVVTYTGDGTTNRAIAHSLGSVPGCIVVKATSTTGAWFVYHRSLPVDPTFGPYRLQLNSTAAQVSNDEWGTAPTSTAFTVNNGNVNSSGVTYVAYVFAHNAGGFGLTGTDNVISCGSYTTVGGEASINLGYEPQWVMVKRSDGVGNWFIINNMMALANDRLFGETNFSLSANTSAAQANFASPYATATGFENNGWLASAGTFIYIAIRRGPMKTPTTGTSVFATQATAGATDGTPNANRFTSNFPVDLLIGGSRAGSASNATVSDRLRGGVPYLVTSSTNAEASTIVAFDDMDGTYLTSTVSANSNANGWMFRRAPGFFDVVCYTGTGSARTVTHNLGVAPELMIVKRRDTAANWPVYSQTTGNTKYLYLNSSAAAGTFAGTWNSTTPTATSFYVGADNETNGSGGTFVNYLFASCPGVSKVGSYTGNGSSQTINCGFTGGARFVMIKQTNGTGGWYVFDTARGINSSGVDPYLFLNSTAAETTYDQLEPNSSGFTVVSPYLTASGSEFIYLAIA